MGDRQTTSRAIVSKSDSAPGSSAAPARAALDRISSFRVTYLAIVAFIFLYVFTVKVLEAYLQIHFEKVVAAAIERGNPNQPVVVWVQRNLRNDVAQSAWVRVWKVNVAVTVIARDTRTFLYINGSTPALPTAEGLSGRKRERERLLPATASVSVSVPHTALIYNAIVVGYGILLFTGLFTYNRHVVSIENRIIDDALIQRDRAAQRTRQIEDEIEDVRRRVQSLEPEDTEHREEISRLHIQRKELENQLGELAAREFELRGKAELAARLEQEGQALEELLEEASGDLESKDAEIRQLETSLKRAIKAGGNRGGREKENELLAKRMRVLYPNLEIDDRAIDDIVDLRDESTKLRVEECLKRLSEDVENVSLRRKVGGLPNHLSVYEIGFAGKRRIYYTRSKDRRIRVLVIGAKNTQDGDLAYMSRIPKSDVGV